MTNAEFDNILKNDTVCIKFGATWCQPCKALAPVIEEISREYDGKAVVMDVDVEDSPDIASKYRIRNVPTILFFKQGVLSGKVVGSVSKKEITDKIDSIL